MQTPRASRGAVAVSIPGLIGFDHCLERPPVLRQGVFAFHVVAVKGVDGSAQAWRLGLVIPKRFEQSAVARNSIKRRWREAFRVRRVGLVAEFGGADLVIRMTAPLVAKDVASTLTAQQRGRFDAGDLMTTFMQRVRTRQVLAKGHA